MKNYKEMSDLETVMIKFEMFNAALQVITNGVESSTSKDLNETMYYIKDVIETFNKELRSKFDAAWEASKEPIQKPTGSSYPYQHDNSKSLEDAYDEISRADLSNGFR